MKPLFLTALLLLAACSSANDDAVQTAAAELVTAAAVQTGTAETAAAVQTSTAEAQAVATRQAELDSAVATAVVETAAAESVQTAVVATQEAAFTPTPQPLTCAEQASGFLSPLGGILGRWQDAIEIANSTARISLNGPVSDLQAIRREVDDLEAPLCASQAKSALISSMDHVIEGFLIFMQDPDDNRRSDEFADAAAAMKDFSTIVQGISAEATRESAGD